MPRSASKTRPRPRRAAGSASIPAQCRTVLQGTIDARSYAGSCRALPRLRRIAGCRRTGTADLCVGRQRFRHRAAARLPQNGQRLARFTEVKLHRGPTTAMVAYLAEEAGYDDEQARLAGIQRLLVIAGYDANPIDGVDGPKTQAAIDSFSRTTSCPPKPSSRLILRCPLGGRQQAARPGFHVVQRDPLRGHGGARRPAVAPSSPAAGTGSKPAAACIRSSPASRQSFQLRRGGRCHRPPAELGGKPLRWGGTTLLCTRNSRFELTDHSDCPAMGLTAAGFAAIDVDRRAPTIVRFRCHDDPVAALGAAPASGLCRDRDLGIRSRQHALPASRQSVAAGRRRASATTSRDYLDISHEEAFRLQKDYYRRYGTTMRGMMTEHGDGPDDYLDLSCTRSIIRRSCPIRRWARRSSSLPGRKLILTNGTRKHAEAVLQRLQHRPPFRGRLRHRRRRPRAQAAAAGL